MTQSGPEPRYEVARKGTTLGTYGLSEVAAEIASGNLAWTDDCWTEGMESWCKLADIKDQVDALAAVVIASPSAPSRTLLYVGVACISLLSVGAGSYLYLSNGSDIGPGDASHTPTAATAVPARGGLDKPLSLKLSETQAKVTVLVASSFDTIKDPAGLTTYGHRYYRGMGNRIPLRVQIESDGRCYLRTFYQGKNWIFHNKLKFAFDQQTMETTAVPAYRCAREIGEDNSVTESCRFDGTDDVKLIGRLAGAAGSHITFQMLGRIPTERTLSHETKQALRESYELSGLLETRRKLLADLAITP